MVKVQPYEAKCHIMNMVLRKEFTSLALWNQSLTLWTRGGRKGRVLLFDCIHFSLPNPAFAQPMAHLGAVDFSMVFCRNIVVRSIIRITTYSILSDGLSA